MACQEKGQETGCDVTRTNSIVNSRDVINSPRVRSPSAFDLAVQASCFRHDRPCDVSDDLDDRKLWDTRRRDSDDRFRRSAVTSCAAPPTCIRDTPPNICDT